MAYGRMAVVVCLMDFDRWTRFEEVAEQEEEEKSEHTRYRVDDGRRYKTRSELLVIIIRSSSSGGLSGGV